MAIDVDQELSVLKNVRTADLREKYAQLHGEQSRSGNREYLIKRIIWRLQAIDQGDLAVRAQQIRIQGRAMDLARDADLRLLAPGEPLRLSLQRRQPPQRTAAQAGRRAPMPGTVLSRKYRGRTIQVRVLEKGFEYEGQPFRSLSAIAHAVTGSHWNGWLFFGLTATASKPEATE